jgi:hypothetical protein
MEQSRLPASLAGILFEGVFEYDGGGPRDVPARTFKGKYVFIAFLRYDDEDSQQTIQNLQTFHLSHPGKCEMLLVSCDTSLEGYSQLVKSTQWPALPMEDNRKAVLRTLFKVHAIPDVLLIDPDYYIVHSGSVLNFITQDPPGSNFPWEWEAETFTSMINRLKQAPLEQNPEDSGHNKAQPIQDSQGAVGLVFGERWDPQARALFERVTTLYQRLQYFGRPGDFYWCRFPDDQDDMLQNLMFAEEYPVPFPRLRLREADRVPLLKQFFSVDSPALCLISPHAKWVVRDGAQKVDADPSGVLFPWVGDPIAQLNPKVVETAAASPIMIAWLQSVNQHRIHALQTLRAIATVYREMGAEALAALSPSDLEKRKQDAALLGSSGLSDIAPRRGNTESTASRSGEGSAVQYQRARSLLFYYCVDGDSDVASLIENFCCSDENRLRRHTAWMRQQLAEEDQFARSLDAVNNGGEQMIVDQRNDDKGAKGLPYSGAYLSNTVANTEDVLAHLPRSELELFRERMETSEDGLKEQDRLGDGQNSTGSIIILDMAQGQYFHLGTACNERMIVDFLHDYERALLPPRPVRMLHESEEVDPSTVTGPIRQRDKKKKGAAKMMGVDTSDSKTPVDSLPKRMPCILAWLLNEQHVAAGASPDFLYRSMIVQALSLCPTNDDVVRMYTSSAASLAASKKGDTYNRRVFRFLIFADESVPDDSAASDQESHFALRLKSYVQRIVDEEARGNRKDLREVGDSMLEGDGASEVSSESDNDEEKEPVAGDDADDDKWQEPLEQTYVSLLSKGLLSLQKDVGTDAEIVGNNFVTLYHSDQRTVLTQLMLDELSYQVHVIWPAPPLTLVLFGDIPDVDAFRWPAAFKYCHVFIVGYVKDRSALRKVLPTVSIMDFEEWIEQHADDHISTQMGRNLSVNWA